MSVTFSNARYTGSQASTGIITGPLLGGTYSYTGTALTGAAGLTGVTIAGTIDQPLTSTVTIDIDAANLTAVGATGTYLGYSALSGGHYEYYFAVTGGGLVTPLTVAVSSTALPVIPTPIAVNEAAVSAPADPSIPNATPGPAFQSASVSGNTVTLAYNEALSPATALPTAFTVTVDGTAVQPLAAAVDLADPRNLRLTLATPVTSAQAVTVAYRDPTISNDLLAVQDTAGNDAASLPATAATNATPQLPGPAFQSASVSGNTVTLAYNEALSPATALPTAFTVTVDGTAVQPLAAAVDLADPRNLRLTLATPVTGAQAVTVAYQDPSAANDPLAVQDTAGNDAASLAATAAMNLTPGAPSSGGSPGGGATPGGGTTPTAGNPTTGLPTPPPGSVGAQTLPPGSTVAQGNGDLISIDPFAGYRGQPGTPRRDGFTITGHVAATSGVSSVTISAMVDGGDTVVLGQAKVAPDGTYRLLDRVGPHLQAFITATETDALGNTLSVGSPYSLQAGLHDGDFQAEQDLYTPDGNTNVAVAKFKSDGSRVVDVLAPGQTFTSNFFDTFDNHGRGDNTFVFENGHGLDVVTGFKLKGDHHDTISLPSADFQTFAAVLANAHNGDGGVVITDPTSGDTLKLAGVTKAGIGAHPSDFTFHG